MGRSLCRNGLALTVLMVCVVTEVRPKSLAEAENASRFLMTIFTRALLIFSGATSSEIYGLFYTFSDFPCCTALFTAELVLCGVLGTSF